MECVNKEICPFFEKEEKTTNTDTNAKNRAFGSKKVDYYKLQLDIGESIRKGTIFYHDPEDTIRGSILDGCLKMCYAFDGSCQNGLVADTIVFHTDVMKNENIFKEVKNPRKKKTQEDIIQEFISIGVYNPNTGSFFVPEKNDNGEICGINIIFCALRDIECIIKEISGMKNTDFNKYIINNTLVSKNRYREYYSFDCEEAINEQIKKFFPRPVYTNTLITIQELLTLIGIDDGLF